MWDIGHKAKRNICLIFFILLFFIDSVSYAQHLQYNVILVSIDTLRVDHLGCYGYQRNTSPNLDKLAEEAILFEQAISQAGATLPSHASIFTSQYPFVHGADTVATVSGLNEEAITLAEILKNSGYKTAAFTGGGHLKRKYGIAQGFDVYYDEGRWDSVQGSFNTTVPLAINWLIDNKQDRFFLFLHGYDVHVPYYQPQPFEHMFDIKYKGIIDRIDLTWESLARIYKDRYLDGNGNPIKLHKNDINHIIAHYDGGIRYADEKIGEFVAEIKKLGLWDNSIIVVLSDHGDDLFEHGNVGKHRSPYDEVLHVPLFIRYPESKFMNKSIDIQVQLIDIMPTILDLLNIQTNTDEIQGNSLVDLIEGTAGTDFNKFVYSHYGNGIVRTKRWKLIDKFMLFDLENDPDEKRNMIDNRPDVALEHLQELYKWSIKNDILKWKIIMRTQNYSEDDKETKDNGYW